MTPTTRGELIEVMALSMECCDKPFSSEHIINDILSAIEAAGCVVVGMPDTWSSAETMNHVDLALHDIGTPQPKESKQWCREFITAWIAASPFAKEK